MKETTLLNELKRILSYKDKFDETVISLYDLSETIKKKSIYYQKTLTRNIKTILNDNCDSIKLKIHHIDFDKNELILTLDYGLEYKLVCKKENGVFVLKPLENTPNFVISKFNTQELERIYNNVMKYKDYVQEEYYRVPSSNTSFLINMRQEGISTYKETNDEKEFIISSYIFKNDYILNTNLQSAKELISQNEELILKNIFIKIENCPKWAQNKLYQIRQKQIKTSILPKVRTRKK